MNCIDWLTYKSYEAQRINSPNIKYQRWGILFANIEILETIYQGMNDMQQFDGEYGRQIYQFMKAYETAVYEFADARDIGWDEAEKTLIGILNEDIAYADSQEALQTA